MAGDYPLQALMDLRRRRADGLRQSLQAKQASIEERQKTLEALAAEEGLLCEPEEVQAREQAMKSCGEEIEALQREVRQLDHELEQERKELWVLQMHKDKWAAEQG